MYKDNSSNEMKFTSDKKLFHTVENGYLIAKLLLVVFVISVVTAAVIYYKGIDKKDISSDPSILTSHTRLISVNSDYRAAEELRSKGSHIEALNFYEKAKIQSHSNDLGQIEFKLGSSLIASGDITGGVSYLKNVASNNNYNGFVRAYSINEIASAYFREFNPEFTREIFKDEPYKSMYIEGDVKASYNNLYKYSVSIQSTAQAELRIARYLVESLSVDNSIDLVEKSNIVNEITKHIESANEDLLRIVSYDKNSADVTYFLMGQVTSMLHRLGIRVGVTPEFAFENALVYAKERPDQLNYVPSISYSYAVHLAHLSDYDRHEKIKQLMNDVYDYPNFNRSTLYKRFQQQKDDLDSLDYKNAFLVSQIDPQFKHFLIGIGWSI